MDYPNLTQDGAPTGVIATFSYCSQGGNGVFATSNFSVLTNTWGTANRAIYVPVMVVTRIIAYQIFWWNGATLGGNIDAGIYDEGPNLLVNSGSTAQAGASTIQAVNITDTELDPGVYYFALANSTTTATLCAAGVNVPLARSCGCASQNLAGLPLPATATFATMSAAVIPAIGVAYRNATI